jgi:type II secretory pathway pseudopilin PulG
MKKILSSQRGFGLIQVLGALIIVTISLSGLFISAYFARHKAIENYHYRVALLKATQKLEEIKYNHRNKLSSVVLNDVYGGTFIMDDEDGDKVVATIHPPQKSTFTDPTVANYIAYDVIEIKVTWKDGPARYLRNSLNKTKTLVLREDYFYRTDVVIP